jgi:hypothetical protein
MVGTARGITHETRHLPNQDSADFREIAGYAPDGKGRHHIGRAAGPSRGDDPPYPPAGGVVVAVADGHGAVRHFRSSAGSLLAARAACAVVQELTADASAPWTAGVAESLRDQLPRAIVTRWRELVARHLELHPFTPDELSALELAGDRPEIPYGSTLLVAVIAGGWLVCAQIGDGDMLAVRPDGQGWTPVAGDDQLDGFHTTSLCQVGAVGSFRTAAYDLQTEPLLALLLGTDGYGNAQVADPWQPEVAQDIAELAARHDHRWFERQLPGWAERCASAAGSGDDTTIALLLAPDSLQVAAAARPAIESDLPTGPPAGIVTTAPAASAEPAAAGTAPAAARRRRWPWAR